MFAYLGIFQNIQSVKIGYSFGFFAAVDHPIVLMFKKQRLKYGLSKYRKHHQSKYISTYMYIYNEVESRKSD